MCTGQCNPQVFLETCKVAGLGSNKEVEKILREYETRGQIVYTDYHINIKKTTDNQ